MSIMNVDIIIKNGNVVTTEGMIEDCCVAIKDEKIVAITKEPNSPSAEKVIDAKSKYILPGAVDPHFHLGISKY